MATTPTMPQSGWTPISIGNLLVGPTTQWDGGATLWDAGTTSWDVTVTQTGQIWTPVSPTPG